MERGNPLLYYWRREAMNPWLISIIAFVVGVLVVTAIVVWAVFSIAKSYGIFDENA
jgi:hypothetical protein